MVVLANRVKVNTATTGTGNVTLGSAVAGYQTFADGGIANNQDVSYVIEDGNDWEIGTGTYTSGSNQLNRHTIIESSNSDAALNLSGSATVFITALAGDIQQPPSEGAFVDGDKTKLDGIEAGATADQTASEILTAIKTVDGSGSGLDADTVDGLQASQFLRSDADDSTDSNISGGIDSSLSGFLLPQNPEGKHLKSPFFFNDIAFSRIRGATVSVDVDGTPMTNTTSIDAMFNTSGDFWNLTPTAGVTTATITVTDAPKTLTYGCYVGISFGNTGWRAGDVTLQYSTDNGSTWTTARSVTNQTEEYVVASFGLAGGVSASAFRWILSNFNTTSMRVASLFAYNYNSDGMKGLYVGRDGGDVYGSLTVSGTVDGRDVATDGTKLDGIEAGADVTDAANVTAAGALMDSELTSEASVKALNQGVATTDSPSFAGFTSTGNASFSATKQLAFTGRSDGSGSIDQLLKLSAGDIYGRPSVSYYDAAARHRASAAFHERDGTSGSPGSYHDAYEIKTSADPAGGSPSDMRTRFSVGTDADLVDVTVNLANNFYVRDGSTTTFAVNTGSGDVTLGDGTNEEVKIDIAGSRVAIGYDLTGGNIVVQGGPGKGISFCTNNATFGSGEVWSINSAGVLTTADAVTGDVMYLGLDNVARAFGISGTRAKFGYSGSETYVEGGASKGVGLRVNGSGTSTLSISSAGVTSITGDLTLGGAIDETVHALSGTSVALDPSNGTVQTHTLSGATTYTDSLAAGEAITLMIDDGTAYTITWPTTTWVNNGGSAPTLATTGYTVVALWKVSTTLYGALVGDGS